LYWKLSPFGRLLPLIKFFDLVGFKEIFDATYRKPVRDPKIGHQCVDTWPKVQNEGIDRVEQHI
jgi:hypothetical protein